MRNCEAFNLKMGLLKLIYRTCCKCLQRFRKNHSTHQKISELSSKLSPTNPHDEVNIFNIS